MDVKKTLKRYKRLQIDLNERLEEVKLKEQALSTNISSNLIDSGGLTGDDHHKSRRQKEMKRARLRATEVLQDILLLKLSFVNDVIDKLQLLSHENPLQVTPFHLQFSRFYDWAETSQQLYDLNAQLYDIEKSKWNIQELRYQQPTYEKSMLTDHSLIGTHPNITDALSRLDSVTSPVNSYISERLQPRNQRMTFEASKIEEYIAECDLYQGGTLQLPPNDSSGIVRGAHPRSYHGFVEVLCNYIVERHKSSQGEDLPYAAIYTAIEHNVIPRIKHFVLKYISKAEDDAIIQEQCKKFSDITLGQLRVPLALRSHELIPFADSIAHMRATFFSQSPTDKMYSVVAAAKALHEQLSMMDEGSIDGDTFLDFWVYVTIKANVRDMATNVQFMSEYGNPQLSIAEAGYYLTTLSAAISYIKTLSAEKLQKQEEINSQFVLCEVDALNWSASQCGIFMEVVSQKELVGYAPAVVKKWVLDKSRPFSTVLVETSDSSDKVQVAIVRFSSKKLSSKHAEYFYDILTNFDVHGICYRSSEDGCVVVADPKICGEELIILNSRNILEQLETLRYSIQLIRLGSQVPEDDEEYPPIRSSVPVSAVANSLSYLTSKQHDRSGKGRRDNSALLSCHVDYDTYRLSKERTKEFVVTAEVHHLEVDSETDCGKKKMVQNHCKNLTGKDDESSTVFTCDIVYLEQNYRENHMYGNQSGSVKESSLQLTKQCQMMLQKLSFLSHIHCLDGQYDDDTMNAVQSFQIAHNQQDDFSSIQLPENGYLSIATLQYLRQELLTVFANLMRLRKNVGLDVLTSFDPMSIDPDDMKKFFNFIVSFQKKVKIPQTGTLCTKTIFHIKRLLQVQQTFSFRGNSF